MRQGAERGNGQSKFIPSRSHRKCCQSEQRVLRGQRHAHPVAGITLVKGEEFKTAAKKLD
jgi:hypothetical protein